jgi:hypothetical protein
MAEDKEIKAYCDRCGGGVRNHIAIKEYSFTREIEEISEYEFHAYQIIKCRGCDKIRFCQLSMFSDDLDEQGNQLEKVTVYPETKPGSRSVNPRLRVIRRIGQIYLETMTAFNGGANILAGGGLRAIVEAICQDQGITGRTLQAKIDELAERGLLTKPQAELLHEERFIGNAALHELEPPAENELTLGLDIIEGLLSTIYILPTKAEQLRRARERRANQATGDEDAPF